MDFILGLISQIPWMTDLIMIVGSFRLIFKPLLSLVRTIVELTDTTKDDLLLDEALSSKAFSAIMYIVDYLTSIKSVR